MRINILVKHAIIGLFLGCMGTDALAQAPACSLPASAPGNYDFDMASDYFGANPDAPTDYYKLAVNWSAAHCEKIQAELHKATNQKTTEKLQQENQFQCFSGNRFGWILHGLWASSCAGKSLAQCTDLTEIKNHPRFCRGDLPALRDRLGPLAQPLPSYRGGPAMPGTAPRPAPDCDWALQTGSSTLLMK